MMYVNEKEIPENTKVTKVDKATAVMPKILMIPVTSRCRNRQFEVNCGADLVHYRSYLSPLFHFESISSSRQLRLLAQNRQGGERPE